MALKGSVCKRHDYVDWAGLEEGRCTVFMLVAVYLDPLAVRIYRILSNNVGPLCKSCLAKEVKRTCAHYNLPLIDLNTYTVASTTRLQIY